MRDSSSLGTFCWSVVSQVIPEMVKLSAPTKAQAISHGRARCRPSASSGSPLSPPRSRLVRSGWRSTSRYMSTLISSRPTALVLSTRPQAASPLRCRVRSGPRICHGPTLRRLMAQNDSAMAETQRIERKARQPSRMSAASPGRRAAPEEAAAAGSGGQPDEEPGGDDEAERVQGDGPAAADADHEQAGRGGPEDLGPVLGRGEQGVGLLHVGGLDEVGHDAAQGRGRERLHGAVADLEHGDQGQAVVAGEQHGGDAALGQAGAEVGGDQHLAAGEPVPGGPADQQQGELGSDLAGQDDAEVAGPAGGVEHGEGQRDGGHGAAEEGDEAAEEEPAEGRGEQRRAGISRPAAWPAARPAHILTPDGVRTIPGPGPMTLLP